MKTPPIFFENRLITRLLVFLFFFFIYMLTSTLPVDLVLDLRFLYSPDTIRDCLDQMGIYGRESYFIGILFLDIPYLLVYGFLFCKILKNLWAGTQLFYLTITIAIADLLENLLMMYHIQFFPEISNFLGYTTSAITSLKWLLVFVLFTLILVGLAKKIFVPSKEKERVY